MRQLPLSAVDDDQLGQGFTFFRESLVPSINDFTHRSEIIGANHGLNVELSIVGFRWLSIFEHNTSGRGTGSLDVAVVKAFDVNGQCGQAKVFLHRLEKTLCRCFGIGLLQVFLPVTHVKLGIAFGELYQPQFIASLRHVTRDARQGQLNEERRVNCF